MRRMAAFLFLAILVLTIQSVQADVNYDQLFEVPTGQSVDDIWGYPLAELGDSAARSAIFRSLRFLQAGRMDDFMNSVGLTDDKYPEAETKAWVAETYFEPEARYLRGVPDGAIRATVSPWRDGWIHINVSYRNPNAKLRTTRQLDGSGNISNRRVPVGTLHLAWRNGKLVSND